MIRRFAQPLACVAFLCGLAACGGGGGSGPAPSAPLAAPPAGPLGVVLAADAADLRPLAGGAQWKFHGRELAADGSTAAYYDSSLSLTAVADGPMSESEFNVFTLQGGQSLTVDAVGVHAGFGIATSPQTKVSALLLRSPVQVNDRYEQWRVTAVPVGDVDQDGKDDLADILVYATVVGQEQVALPELHRSVTAVRVDSTQLLRLTLSSTGAIQPVQTYVRSTWYARGVGIVRQTATVPTDSGAVGPVKYDEVLDAWNGMTAGMGAVGPDETELPQDLWCCSGAEYMPQPFAAAAVGDEAMLIGGSSTAAAPTDLTASVFSKTGQLLRVAELPNLGAFANGSLYATGATSALLVALDTSSPGQLKVDLQALDDTPAAVGAPHAVSLPTTNIEAATAWDGQRLWVMWQQSLGLSGSQLMLQVFDANGNPLAAALVLDTTTIGAMGSMHLAADQGRTLATWLNGDIQDTRFRYAVVADPAAGAQVFTLGSRAQGYTGSYDFDDAPVPVLGGSVAALTWRGPQFSYAPGVLGGSVAALTWRGPQFSYAPGGPLPDEAPRGVLLDANWQPLRSDSGSLDDETLPTSWATPAARPLVVAALGDRLVFAGYAMQQQTSFSASLLDMLDTSFLSPGNVPLASAAAGATSYQAPGGNWLGGLQSEMPSLVLLWPDRALIVGTSPTLQGTALTQVWLN